MEEMSLNPAIRGFTTNPTLMRKSGVVNYDLWAIQLCEKFPTYPISFEVIADDFDEMERQARRIASWGPNVYVKIPVTTTDGTYSGGLICKLALGGIKVNVTAIMATKHIYDLPKRLTDTPAILSIFAGRIADLGLDPVPAVKAMMDGLSYKGHEVLWASPRQVRDVWLADSIGCHIITVTKDILSKLPLRGKSAEDYSLDTVKMFYEDAKKASYEL